MDSTSAEVPVPDYVAELESRFGAGRSDGERIFRLRAGSEVRAAVEAAIQKLAELGCGSCAGFAAAY